MEYIFFFFQNIFNNFFFEKFPFSKADDGKPVGKKGVVFVVTIQQRLNDFQLRRSLFYSSKICRATCIYNCDKDMKVYLSLPPCRGEK